MTGHFQIAGLALVLSLCAGGVSGQIKVHPDNASAHILRIEQNTPDPKIPVESVAGFPEKSSLVINKAKTFKAYVLCIQTGEDRSSCISRVFFTNMRSRATFMILGENEDVERGRPVDQLKWLDNERLSFERWTSPHFGHRYIVNIRLGKQVEAYALSDTVQ